MINHMRSYSVMLRYSMLLFAAFLLCNCAGNSWQFKDTAPVWRIDDQKPIPLPGSTRYIRMDYYFEVLIRRPAGTNFSTAPIEQAQDVNSYDHIPQSSWYTPRLGYRTVSPEELSQGPELIGPPQLPVRVVRAKHLGSNPGFIIADNRDRLYLVKFDPPDFPGIETTTAQIVNRLFWGFGYNVPEDYLFKFTSADMSVDSTAHISQEDVLLVFNTVAPPVNGIYRATASLLIDGVYLGPIADSGVRKDDPNDRIPHENRRILRGLRVFGAFTNQTDIRIDNSLDVYEGLVGEGFVKHYLLDFGEAFGGHGAGHERLWDGYEHIFSFKQMIENLATLGLKKEPWESLEFTPWTSVGAFEAEVFDPGKWKETYPFKPIQNALADDNYWAAKIVASLTPAHFQMLVDSADYPEEGAADYIVDTLNKRQKKVVEYFYNQVSPLEFYSRDADVLTLEDRGIADIPGVNSGSYQIRFFDKENNEVLESIEVVNREKFVDITLPLTNVVISDGYLRLDVRVIRNGSLAPRPAQIHLRAQADGDYRVVGVVH
ncbi:MAG: hypothetical protein ACRBF0_19075 [Calditrichia bacterium]